MIKTSDFTTLEKVDLSAELGLVAATDTPLMTYLTQAGKVKPGNSTVYTWREKTLDSTADISIVEGGTASTYTSSRAEKNNIMQIFSKATEISGTANAIGINGITPNLFASEINDRLTEAKVRMEYAVINGTRLDGSSSPFIRKMDGLLALAASGNAVTNASLTEAKFKELLKNLWTNGLSGNYIAVMNASLKETVDGFYSSQYQYNAPQDTFGIVARTVQTNYGNVTLVLNRHMPDSKILVFDPSYVNLVYLRHPVYEPLAKTGDAIKGQVVAEMTLELTNGLAAGVFTKS